MCRPPHCHPVDLPVELGLQEAMAPLLVLSKANAATRHQSGVSPEHIFGLKKLVHGAKLCTSRSGSEGGSLVHAKRLQSFLGHHLVIQKRKEAIQKGPCTGSALPAILGRCSSMPPLPGMLALPQAPGVQPLCLSEI